MHGQKNIRTWEVLLLCIAKDGLESVQVLFYSIVNNETRNMNLVMFYDVQWDANRSILDHKSGEIMWNSALPCQIDRDTGETSILRRFSTIAKNIINFFMFVSPSGRM